MSPKLIGSLDPDKNQKDAENYYNKNKKKFEKTKTKFLLKSGDNHNGYYMFVTPSEEIEYFVKYTAKNIPFDIGKSTRQVLVHRNKNSALSAGIPKTVFFEYLLPVFGSIISDIEQTGDGKRFWEGAVTDALKQPTKYDVFVINKAKKEKTKIIDQEHLAELTDSIWGSENIFEYILLVIVQK